MVWIDFLSPISKLCESANARVSELAFIYYRQKLKAELKITNVLGYLNWSLFKNTINII